MKHNKLLLIALSIQTLISVQFLPLFKATAASCPATAVADVTTSIDAAGEYAVWLEQRRPSSSTAVAWISADNGASCTAFNTPSQSDSWVWVSDSQNSPMTFQLTSATSNLKLYVTEGELDLSKLLITLDKECIPDNDGSNCVEEPIDFIVTGIGAEISGEKIIETVLSGHPTQEVQVEYYFDNQTVAYATQTTSPYCLVLTDGQCAQWPSTTLSDGPHTLTVRAITASGMTEKTFPFTISNEPDPEQPPAPTPTPTPVATPPPSPPSTVEETSSPAPTPQPTPSPQPTSPTTAPAPSPTSVRQAPTPSPTPPTSSPTSSSRNQNSQPTSPTTENTQSIPSQSDASTSEQISTKTNASLMNVANTSNSAVVAGLNLKGEVSGKINVAVPKNITLVTGDKVELLVNGAVVDSIEITGNSSPPSFSFDTTKVKNGSTVISVKVTKKNGGISTYSSTVTVSNASIAAKNNWAKYSLFTLIFVALVIGAIYALRYFKHMRQYDTLHNLNEYTYVQPENPYLGVAGASMAVLFAFTAVLFIGKSQSFAANVGYVYDLSESTLSSGVTVASDSPEYISYIHVPSELGTAPPTTPPSSPPTYEASRLFIFGDSLTVGMAANGLMQIFEDTGFIVNTEYSDNGGEFIGSSIRAKGGWKLSDVEAVVQSHQQDIANAESVVVAIGTNDSPITENYDTRMVSFMRTLQSYNPNVKIFWVNTFFVDDGQWWVVQDGQLLHVTTNPVIAAGVAAARGAGINATLIDFEGAINRGEMIPPDGDYVHYSNQGSTTQARWLAGAVRSALDAQ